MPPTRTALDEIELIPDGALDYGGAEHARKVRRRLQHLFDTPVLRVVHARRGHRDMVISGSFPVRSAAMSAGLHRMPMSVGLSGG